MSIGHVVNIAGGYLQSLFTGANHGSSSTTPTSPGNTQGTNQLSPFAQVLNSLQELEQSSFAKYQQVTQQVAGNLQTASQSATAAGNNSLAGQLTQLSTDFQNASSSGQLPNVQDLAQAIGGGSFRYQHPSGGSPAGSKPGNNAAGNLSEFIQSLNASQAGSSANSSLSALSIIDNTLSSAGIQIG
jgi:hypothetical protein